MVDALVLEASTSVCGFESHLPHQKKRAPKGAFFFWRPLRRGLPLRSMCGRNLRFPHTRPLLFCDTIQFAIETDRSCHRQGSGAEWRSRLFSLPQNLRPRSSRSEPSRIKEGTRKSAFFWLVPPASPRQPFPNPCRRAAHQSSSLFPLPLPHFGLPLPLPGKAREPPSAGAEDQFPGSNAELQNALSPAQPRMPGTGSF